MNWRVTNGERREGRFGRAGRASIQCLQVVCVCLLFAAQGCGDGKKASRAYLDERMAELEAENESIRLENKTLRNENRTLRQLVATNQQPSIVAPLPTQQPVEVSPAGNQTPPTEKTNAYWFTTSTGKRHNSACQDYMNSKGRACGSNEGITCKICGG